ncbi:HNH endonuclease [Natronorubrum halophilum]|uniref:HNH endonuclease n=1 Tax=Natronorubrum halophilum TaxID=1702106 RepID=UPI000EF69AFA|nr:HNH endonuclease [Natronorubrum halophilum]
MTVEASTRPSESRFVDVTTVFARNASTKVSPEKRQKSEDYEAAHIFPHSKGGETDIENPQLLCKHHNQVKGSNSV